MKQIAIAAFALSVWVIFIPQNSRQPSAGVSKKEGRTDAQLTQDAHDKQQAAETAALNSILATIAKNEQEAAAERQQEAAVESENVRFQRWMIGLGIAQTLALIGTLFAIWYQAKKTADAAKATNEATSAINTQIGLMERQTRSIHHQAVQVKKQTRILNESAKATQKAAEAALLNARAIINIERPWLDVEATIKESGMAGPRFFTCSNRGKTPAKFVSASIDFSFVDLPESLPIPLEYRGSFPYFGPSLIPFGGGFEYWPKGFKPDDFIQRADMQTPVQESRKFLIYYGNVCYRDALYPDDSPEGFHETRWCYVWRPSERIFVRGPDAYNGYT